MKHARLQWWASSILHLSFSLIVPCVLVALRYDIFNEPSTIKIGAGFIIIMFIVLFFATRNLKRKEREMKEGMVKDSINYFKMPVFLFVAYMCVWFLEDQLENVSFILLWGAVSVSVGTLCAIWHNQIARAIKIDKQENSIADKVAERMKGE